MNQISLELALIVVLVLINGVLSGSELAIVSARRHRLQQRADSGDPGARVALDLAAEPNRFLSIVRIGITLVGILAGAFGGATLAEQAALRFEDAGMGEGAAGALGVGLIVLAITFLSLVFGELVPKRIALAHPERIAGVMSRPLRALGIAGRPVVAVLSGSTNLVLGLLRIREDSDRSISAEELHMLLLESTRAGVIEAGEQEFASAALQLGDIQVSAVMTPRPEVTWLDLEDHVEANLALVAASPHHWFPVLEENADRILGAVAVRDLFRASLSAGPIDLRSLAKPVAFLPESLPLLSALERMRDHQVPLAIVVDEYGGTAGMVTMNDVVGAVVGDIGRDADERPEVESLGPGAYSIDGRAPLSRLETALDLRGLAASSEYQTLAGFVLHALGHIPEVGESIEWEGFRFEVTEMDGRRVSRVELVSTWRTVGENPEFQPLPRAFAALLHKPAFP